MILSPFQGFSFGETDFYFCQFLSSFFKYSFSNFPLSYLYNIFAINFPSNSPLLKFFFSAISNFSCLLTSTFILPSNFSSASFTCPKSSPFSHVSCSTINPFHFTKYFSVLLIFLLFSIFSTFHSSTSSTSIGLPSSFFCPSTCSLYYTIWLIFTTGWILIEVGSCNLTALVDTTFLIVYGPTYWSTNFLTGHFLNTKSFILNITLSPFFQSSTSFLSLSTCLFISSCAFFNAALASSCIFFIYSTNSIAFFTFPFFLIFSSTLNFLS